MEIQAIRIDGNSAYVPLTKGFVAVIDAIDVPLVSGKNWFAMVGSNSVYAYRTEAIGGRQTTVRMHRLIMDAPKSLDVDHKDGDGLNNRRSNLRLATTSQNMFNQRLKLTNTSGFKGVTWDKSRSKWLASIKVNYKNIHLGRFKSAEDAHVAYLSASKRLHGEFGRSA